MIFRLRFVQKGGHIHCRLFQATAAGHTWQKNGDLVFDEPGWRAFSEQTRGHFEMLPEDDATSNRHDLAAMYDLMSVAELTLLQTAFRVDQAHAESPETRAFCEDRLFLIDAALRARAITESR
jgi:hypothetical protein